MAGRLAERARASGVDVRGVMGYEGHIVGLEDRSARAAMLEDSMAQLVQAAGDVHEMSDRLPPGTLGVAWIAQPLRLQRNTSGTESRPAPLGTI